MKHKQSVIVDTLSVMYDKNNLLNQLTNINIYFKSIENHLILLTRVKRQTINNYYNVFSISIKTNGANQNIGFLAYDTINKMINDDYIKVNFSKSFYTNLISHTT